ncbi:MAG: GHKL domain-containing protein [Oscillospiraceae bacterium]|nr:GHKL domain-containing protein [Oscillospiraceae bacterium]
MGIFLFVIGTLLLLGIGTVVAYFVIEESPEDFYYRTLGSFYLMTALIFVYCFFGDSVFGEIAKSWIVFAFTILFCLYLLLYVIFYVDSDELNVRLLLLVPIVGIEIWQLVHIWSVVWTAIVKLLGILINNTFVSSLFAFLIISFTVSYINKQRYKSKLRRELYHSRYSSNRSDFSFGLYNKSFDSSGNIPDDIIFLVMKMYQYAKDDRLSPSRINAFLMRYEDDIPPSIRNRVMDRFMESYHLHNMEYLNLLEFATLLFPEYFGSYKMASTSSKYDFRLFEEYYELSQRSMSKNKMQFEELNAKIDKLSKILVDKPLEIVESIDIISDNTQSSMGQYNQSIVREIAHLIKTPLLTINTTIKNLQSNKNEHLSDIQKGKMAIIRDNVQTINLIIDAYRKLETLSETSVSDAIVPHLKTAIISLCESSGKSIKTQIGDFPEKLSVHGNNVITILLLPLINNAIEASPENSDLKVFCNEKTEGYLITVENKCKVPPKQNDLDKDGFSTKPEGGEGLRSIRRIAKSIGIKFKIVAYNKDKKVIATLTIPKNTETVGGETA